MDREIYERMADQDQAHWWFVARRQILSDLIRRRASTPPRARILEVGCGTGHNLAMLGRFGAVEALEVDESARRVAVARLGRPIGSAPLPDLDGVPDGAYDLIALLDVLEHVDDDTNSLRSLHRKLAPGGRLVLTVPANPWMWSAHDELHHHKRRYTRRGLIRVARAAGLKVEMITYFNTLLFPLAAALRIAGKVRGKSSSDDTMPSPAANAALRSVFGLERHLAGRVPLPFGVSLVAVLS